MIMKGLCSYVYLERLDNKKKCSTTYDKDQQNNVPVTRICMQILFY